MWSFERVTTGLLVVCAVALTGVALRREFSPTAGATAAVPVGSPERVRNWTDIVDAGIGFGPESADVHIVEFADLECPFCRRFHELLRRVESQYPNDVRWTWVHYPLTTHRFARPAAEAAECADAAGRFRTFVDAVLRTRTHLGFEAGWRSPGTQGSLTRHGSVDA
jgi:hypothetical protein